MKKSFFLVVLILAVYMAHAQPGLQDGFALKYLVQQPAVKTGHPPVIILLHGYGSDERDLFELKGMLPNNYLLVSARAPYALRGGGYQWYDIAVGAGRDKEIAASREKILTFIGQVVGKYGADAKAVYVIGFSQGAIMSYEVGLTAPGKIKGIGPLSGRIYPSLKPLVKNTPELKQLRVFVSHGTADDRIPFADGKAAVDYVKGLGLKPEFHEYKGMGHSISSDVMKDLVHWLTK